MNAPLWSPGAAGRRKSDDYLIAGNPTPAAA